MDQYQVIWGFSVLQLAASPLAAIQTFGASTVIIVIEYPQKHTKTSYSTLKRSHYSDTSLKIHFTYAMSQKLKFVLFSYIPFCWCCASLQKHMFPLPLRHHVHIYHIQYSSFRSWISWNWIDMYHYNVSASVINMTFVRFWGHSLTVPNYTLAARRAVANSSNWNTTTPSILVQWQDFSLVRCKVMKKNRVWVEK